MGARLILSGWRTGSNEQSVAAGAGLIVRCRFRCAERANRGQAGRLLAQTGPRLSRRTNRHRRRRIVRHGMKIVLVRTNRLPAVRFVRQSRWSRRRSTSRRPRWAALTRRPVSAGFGRTVVQRLSVREHLRLPSPTFARACPKPRGRDTAVGLWKTAAEEMGYTSTVGAEAPVTAAGSRPAMLARRARGRRSMFRLARDPAVGLIITALLTTSHTTSSCATNTVCCACGFATRRRWSPQRSPACRHLWLGG